MDAKAKETVGKDHAPSFFLNQFKQVIDMIPGHVYWLDRDGKLLGCNNAMVKAFGAKDKSELIGKTAKGVLSDDEYDTITAINNRIIDEGVIVIKEEPATLHDGRVVIFLSNKGPLYNQAGEIDGVIGISVDITARKELEQQVITLKAKEAANKAKSEFIANMSHDLRTPLSGMIGMAEIMTLDPSHLNVDNVNDFHESSKRLLTLFNQVLEYINTDKFEHIKQQAVFSVRKILDDLQDLFKPAQKLRNIAVITDVADNTPDFLFGYATAVHRVILNLFSNAMKFTEQGSIHIFVDYDGKGPDRGLLKISVQDTGVGIPAEAKDKIFDCFERVLPAYENNKPGAGLGLSIVKRSLEKVNGSIDLISTPGEGSTFICEIPVDVANGDIPEELSSYVSAEHESDTLVGRTTDASALTQKHVHQSDQQSALLVEDDPVAAKVATIILEEFGLHVDHVGSGEAALQQANEQAYDIVFMDIGLPGIDGLETTRQLREHYTMPIVALTGHAKLDATTHESVGLTELLQKPITNDKAGKVLKQYLDDSCTLEVSTEDDDVINLSYGTSLVGGRNELAQEVLGDFVAEIPERIEQLNNYFSKGSNDDLLKLLHFLKGGSSYCGVPRLQEAIIKAHDALKQNESVVDIKSLLDIVLENMHLVADTYQKRFSE